MIYFLFGLKLKNFFFHIKLLNFYLLFIPDWILYLFTSLMKLSIFNFFPEISENNNSPGNFSKTFQKFAQNLQRFT